MHCIISGGGLTKEHKIRRSSGKFFIPIYVLRDKFNGKYLSTSLIRMYRKGTDRMSLPPVERLRNSYGSGRHVEREPLQARDWCPYIKETFTWLWQCASNTAGPRYTPIRSPSPTAVSFP
ncbi:MAG: transposase [Mediterraneibacter gnavus]